MGGKLVVRKTAWYMGGYAIPRIKANNKLNLKQIEGKALLIPLVI